MEVILDGEKGNIIPYEKIKEVIKIPEGHLLSGVFTELDYAIIKTLKCGIKEEGFVRVNEAEEVFVRVIKKEELIKGLSERLRIKLDGNVKINVVVGIKDDEKIPGFGFVKEVVSPNNGLAYKKFVDLEDLDVGCIIAKNSPKRLFCWISEGKMAALYFE